MPRMPAEGLPAGGRTARMHLEFPDGDIRVDAGVRAGDEITPFYDPMIAKVIAHGRTRAEALSKLAGALGRTEIAGTVTNTAFLARLCRDADFAAGRLDTGLIDRNIASLTNCGFRARSIVALAVLAASGMVPPEGADRGGVSGIGPFEIWGSPMRSVTLEVNEAQHDFRVQREGGSAWRIAGSGLQSADMLLKAVGYRHDEWAFRADGVTQRCRLVQSRTEVAVFHEGLTHRFAKPQGSRADDLASGGDQVVSAMPGIIKQVLVAQGQEVKSGEAMVIMEAMKMEMTLSAPRDGVVAEVLVSVGVQVSDGVSLVMLQPEAAAA
jgi:3-methylcrotonyl-CoA carboxylase alpha subunit